MGLTCNLSRVTTGVTNTLIGHHDDAFGLANHIWGLRVASQYIPFVKIMHLIG
jgi:hypothetical protein